MRLDRRDLQFLGMVADYRVMTFEQVAARQKRDSKNTQRRVSQLTGAKLIAKTDRKGHSGPGRRAKLISVAPAGFPVLRDAGALRSDAEEPDVTLAGLPQVEHQLLLNWVRIHWLELEDLHPPLRAQFIPHSSPAVHLGATCAEGEARPVPVFIRLNEREAFTPDAVAIIADIERRKTVLFFVEVDMGTEPFDAPKKRPTILQKIQRYQRYFQTEQYREFEPVWDCALRGFRVLFVTSSKSRSALLGKHFAHIRPREFFWITDEEQLLGRGIGSFIWARGGQQDRPLASILGSRATDKAPVPEPTASPRDAP